MRTVVRLVVGVALGAVVGTVVFLIMIQGSFHQGYTDLDFNHVLGTMIKGTAEEATGVSEALGVVGDTAGPTGLYATLIGAGVLMLLHALVIHPLVRRHWTVQGLVLGAVTALVVGIGFCAVADARLDTPTGIFGVDAGRHDPPDHRALLARLRPRRRARPQPRRQRGAGGRSTRRTSPRRSSASPRSSPPSPHSNSPNRGPNRAAWAPDVSPRRSGGAARASSS